jgi:hypothetical protein
VTALRRCRQPLFGALRREPENQILLRLIGQRVLAFLPVRHGPTQGFPERWSVVAFAQMNEFVGNYVVHESHRKLQNLPVEIENSILTARAPAEALSHVPAGASHSRTKAARRWMGSCRTTSGDAECARHMTRDERRALALLADSGRNGTTDAILAAYGFTADMVTSLVRDGLATAMIERVRAGSRMIEIVRVRITGAGQRRSKAGPWNKRRWCRQSDRLSALSAAPAMAWLHQRTVRQLCRLRMVVWALDAVSADAEHCCPALLPTCVIAGHGTT